MRNLVIFLICIVLLSCKITFETIDDVYYSKPKERHGIKYYRYESNRFYEDNMVEDVFFNYSYGRHYRDNYLNDWYSYYWNPYRPSYYGYRVPVIKKVESGIVKRPVIDYDNRKINNNNNINNYKSPNSISPPVRSYTPSSSGKVDISRPSRVKD